MKRLFLLLFLLCSCSSSFVAFDDVRFDVELAKTPAEQTKGLMFRASLPESDGMFFIFESDAPRNFWMKNTFIPLDMVFIDSNMKVVDLKENVPPCEAVPCPMYKSLPAKFVLEINAGLIKKYNISVGSVVSYSE